MPSSLFTSVNLDFCPPHPIHHIDGLRSRFFRPTSQIDRRSRVAPHQPPACPSVYCYYCTTLPAANSVISLRVAQPGGAPYNQFILRFRIPDRTFPTTGHPPKISHEAGATFPRPCCTPAFRSVSSGTSQAQSTRAPCTYRVGCRRFHHGTRGRSQRNGRMGRISSLFLRRPSFRQ